MAITDREIDQAFSDLKTTCGGVRNDYFGLLYLEDEFSLRRDRAIPQVAFGGNDYGVDGFHFDEAKRNLYLFQFKNSDSHAFARAGRISSSEKRKRNGHSIFPASGSANFVIRTA